ncbi:MAG TPA: IclR family transcriptional regulator, partial [Candidatus Limnocylindrales bacterium]|nr:IclR family transcriptional regulator [Candidatus Limnocylindrales bacterium]
MLGLFSARQPNLNLSELSEGLGVHKSTAYRLAVTLAEGGLLRWNQQKGTYSLGLKILNLGSLLINSLELRSQARPYLEKLASEINETVHLAVLDRDEVVYIDKLEVSRGIRIFSDIGKRAPCHCTALGKALLADLPTETVRLILKKKGMKCYTPNTITSIIAFLDHLEEVRLNDYALDMEEHEPLIYCIAAPIRDFSRKTIATISVTMIMKS